MDQIQNITAEIFAIEDSGTQIKLRDKNKKSLGGFFKLKKDGLPTVAFQQFQDMGLKSGSLVSIGFKEVPYKDSMIKNIIGFRETNEQAQSYQAPPSMVRKEYPNGTYDERSKPHPITIQPIAEPKDETFWNKKAYKQCLWNYWLEKGNVQGTLTDAERDVVWAVFQLIEADANKRFSEVNVDNIPF